MRNYFYLMILGLGIGFIGCEYDKEPDEEIIEDTVNTTDTTAISTNSTDTTSGGNGGGVAGPVAYCDTVKATYATSVKTILDKNCNSSGCHGVGSSFGDFTNYLGIKQVVDNNKLKLRVVTNKDMPWGTDFANPTHRELLECWINKGGPEN